MSTYYSYTNPPPRRRQSVWPFIVLLASVGILGYYLLDRNGVKLFSRRANLAGLEHPRSVTTRGALSREEDEAVRIYEANPPSVVHINNLAERPNYFTRDIEQLTRGSGSGFVWNDKGIIVTNAHVVQGADAVEVILPDKEQTRFETRDWVAYPDKDLAVLYVDAPKDKLRPIPKIGTSADLKVGMKTYAIGNPFGLDQTLTTGIVSALNREIRAESGRPIEGMIQTSAAINPGNSGGPLLDNEGQLIGVNTAIVSPSGTLSGIGFAIPIDEVNRIVPAMIAKLNETLKTESGPLVVRPPKMGVRIAPDEFTQSRGLEGALIWQVEPNSPAARAGLRSTRVDREAGVMRLGDLITAIDGKPIRRSRDVSASLEGKQVGDTVQVTIERDERELHVAVTLASLR
jgi:S1-C subfamily serine protease